MAFLPFLGQAALSMAPGLLNHLFGGDPGRDYRNRVNNLLAPQNMGRLTQQYFQQAMGSPAMSLAQRQVGQGANMAGNAVAQRAGQTGVSQSGVGALAGSVVPSIAGQGLAGLNAQAWQGAQGQAQNSIQQQIAALGGSMPQGQTQSLFAGGLSAFGPLLQAYLQQLGGGGAMAGANQAVRNTPTWNMNPNANPIGGFQPNYPYPISPQVPVPQPRMH